MSAKKHGAKSRQPASTGASTAGTVGGATIEAGPSVAAAAAEPSWLDSADPRRRRWGRIVLVAVWVYVAALWLLALDQWFDWGIFGPKVPPLP